MVFFPASENYLKQVTFDNNNNNNNNNKLFRGVTREDSNNIIFLFSRQGCPASGI